MHLSCSLITVHNTSTVSSGYIISKGVSIKEFFRGRGQTVDKTKEIWYHHPNLYRERDYLNYTGIKHSLILSGEPSLESFITCIDKQ